MGYGVMAYAVDPRVWDVVGGGDAARLAALTDGAGRAAADIDELLADQFAGEPGPHPTAVDLLRHLVMGEPYDQRLGFAYGYWLKYLCERHGDFLRNNAWMPIRIEFIEQVQRALTEAGVPRTVVSVDDVVFGGPPVPLPPINDFPGIGVTPAREAAAAAEALAAADLSGEVDQYVRSAVDELRDWLSTCASRGHQLVCFYH